MTDAEIKNLLNKAKICNRLQEITIDSVVNTELRTLYNECTYINIINMSDKEQIVYIPDGVKIIQFLSTYRSISRYIEPYTKILRVIGGRDLVDIASLLDCVGNRNNTMYKNTTGYRIDLVDLSDLHVAKVVVADDLLEHTDAEKIIMPNEDFKTLGTAKQMFRCTKTDKIIGLEHITKGRFSDYIDLDNMFLDITINELDLSKFITNRLILKEMICAKIGKLILNKNQISYESFSKFMTKYKDAYDLNIERMEFV